MFRERTDKILAVTLVVLSLLLVAGMSDGKALASAFAIPLHKAYFKQSDSGYDAKVVLTQAQTSAADRVASISNPAIVSINIYQKVPIYKSKGIAADSLYPEDGYIQAGTQTAKTGSGSGFFVSVSGYILTNNHVVADPGASFRVVMADGTDLPAAVVYRQADKDLALLKVSGSGYQVLSLGDSSVVKPGQVVVGIGNALGRFANTSSPGTVIDLDRRIVATGLNGDEDLSGLIEASASMFPGDSGGPLLDMSGNVIGVNVAIIEGEDIGFAIPINEAKGLISTVTSR